MSESTLSESTKVRLGLLITILLGVFGGLVGGVWWAATITAKVDTLIEFNASTKAQILLDSQHISDLEKATQKLEWKIGVLESKIGSLELNTKK